MLSLAIAVAALCIEAQLVDCRPRDPHRLGHFGGPICVSNSLIFARSVLGGRPFRVPQSGDRRRVSGSGPDTASAGVRKPQINPCRTAFSSLDASLGQGSISVTPDLSMVLISGMVVVAVLRSCSRPACSSKGRSRVRSSKQDRLRVRPSVHHHQHLPPQRRPVSGSLAPLRRRQSSPSARRRAWRR